MTKSNCTLALLVSIWLLPEDAYSFCVPRGVEFTASSPSVLPTADDLSFYARFARRIPRSSERRDSPRGTRRMTAYPKPVFTQDVESESQVTLIFRGFHPAIDAALPCRR